MFRLILVWLVWNFEKCDFGLYKEIHKNRIRWIKKIK